MFTWTTKNSLVEASRHAGIAVEGLSADWMQQDKFIQAERCMSVNKTPSSSQNIPAVSSPQGVRHGSRDYYKKN